MWLRSVAACRSAIRTPDETARPGRGRPRSKCQRDSARPGGLEPAANRGLTSRMFRRFHFFAHSGIIFLALGTAAVATDIAQSPAPLRATNPRWISGGLLTALDGIGPADTSRLPVRARATGVADLSKGQPPAVLDARVGVNVRLGEDPAALPSAQRGQAEPHIARSAANPDTLLATFQEGRFASGGGSVDCGYALSRDGGLSWARALIPQLTTASGGPYLRATDPVAGIGPQGDLYLNTLASLDNAFGLGAVVVSRSADNGASWSAPSVVFQAPSTQVLADKEWLAVNDFPGVPNSARLVVTWTNFTSNAAGAATGNNLFAAMSDDRGTTWSAPVAITPVGSLNQGTQPLFLPDGSLAVIYITFANANTATFFSIQYKRSTDGGRTFPTAATTVVGFVNGFADPDLRSGTFLPGAAVARTTGAIFVSYVALVAGTPRVMVTQSSDQGATWSTPAIASDNPAGVAVDNAAIAVTPDGTTASIVFIDKRNSPTAADGHSYFIDHYAAQSFDGGATWQPNLRLTEISSDLRYASLTSEGYMLGDYLAIAPSLASDQPCVPIWCDTRTGDADPFVGRLVPVVGATFDAWRVAHFTRAELADNSKSGAGSDPDGDGARNLAEFSNATDPRVAEFGETLVLNRPSADILNVAWVQRTDVPGLSSSIGAGEEPLVPPDSTQSQPLPTPILSQTNGGQVPAVGVRSGLAWRVVQYTGVAGKAVGVGRGVSFATFGGGPPGTAQPVQTMVVSGSGENSTNGTNAHLINLSTRGPIPPGGGPMIAGFVTRGGSRTLLVRGVGPSLTPFGITAFAADPSLLLIATGATTALAQNNDWDSGGIAVHNFIAGVAAQVGAFPLTDPRDAAFVASALTPDNYSAQVSNLAATGGSTGLVEIYDASTNSDGLLVNLSTRGEVGPPENVLIAGFVIGGTQPRRVLLRAVGPSLAQFGVGGTLVDPVLTLYDSTGKVVATNDDWEISRSSAAIAATAQNVGAFALNPASLDSALLITLAPGAYTAVVTGANGATGTVLVEIYDAN